VISFVDDYYFVSIIQVLSHNFLTTYVFLDSWALRWDLFFLPLLFPIQRTWMLLRLGFVFSLFRLQRCAPLLCF